jgi:glutamine synthetase
MTQRAPRLEDVQMDQGPTASSYSDEELADLTAALGDRGVELVAGSVVDMAGVTRAKYVPVSRLAAFHRSGMGASPSWSVFCVDSGIAFTPRLGVTGDLRIRIDPSEVRVVEPGIGWAPGSFHEQDGTPSEMCPRSLLTRTAARVESGLGLSSLVGIELECTMLSEDGGHASAAPWSPYGLRTSLEHAAFLTDLARTAELAGLEIEQIHTEYGHDQLEISLAPATPVAAADSVILSRIVLGRAAARHGLRISFSPVPFAGESGNGAHLHLSLQGPDGPVFSGGSGPRGMTEAGAQATAGILEGLPGLLAVYAGSVLSSARLTPGNWAGAALCWGLENREAALRFIAGTPGNPHGANLELKIVDPSANPYLAVAAMLGSAENGILKELVLPAEMTVDPASSGVELQPLPDSQVAAIEAMEASELAASVLGVPIVEGVAAVRRHEATAYGALPPAEIAQALRLAWTC